jgi:hypothetical protein
LSSASSEGRFGRNQQQMNTPQNDESQSNSPPTPMSALADESRLDENTLLTDLVWSKLLPAGAKKFSDESRIHIDIAQSTVEDYATSMRNDSKTLTQRYTQVTTECASIQKMTVPKRERDQDDVMYNLVVARYIRTIMDSQVAAVSSLGPRDVLVYAMKYGINFKSIVGEYDIRRAKFSSLSLLQERKLAQYNELQPPNNDFSSRSDYQLQLKKSKNDLDQSYAKQWEDWWRENQRICPISEEDQEVNLILQELSIIFS